jgi:hypothetical protein
MDKKFKSFKSNSLASDILQYLRSIQKDYDYGFGIKYQSKKIKDISLVQNTISEISNPELKSTLENILAQQNVSNDFRRILLLIKTTNDFCKQLGNKKNVNKSELMNESGKLMNSSQLVDECNIIVNKLKDIAEKVGDYKEIVLETILNKVKFFIFPKNDEDSKKITDVDTLLKKVNENFSLKNKLIEQINNYDMKTHDTPLSFAARNGMLFVVEYLMKLYAYPGVSNDFGVDSLSSVITHLIKEPEIIQRKAPNRNANLSKLVEFTESEVEAENLFEKIILLLIKTRSPFNVRPDGLFLIGKHFSTTILHELAENTSPFLNRVFLELISGKNIQIDINCQNEKGFTPLFKAIEKYNELTLIPADERDKDAIKIIENNIMNIKNLNARIDVETAFGPKKTDLRSIPMFLKYYLGENPELEKIQLAFTEQFKGLNSVRQEAALINKNAAQAFTANLRAEKAEREAARLQRMLEKEKRIEEQKLAQAAPKTNNIAPNAPKTINVSTNAPKTNNVSTNAPIAPIAPKTNNVASAAPKNNSLMINKNMEGGNKKRKFKISKMKGNKFFEAETPKKAAKKAVKFIEEKLSIKKTGVRYEIIMEDMKKEKKYKYIIKRKLKGNSEINAE